MAKDTMTLSDFEFVASDDSTKTDLEMVCLVCGEHLCDVEAEDSIATLAVTARVHYRMKHQDRYTWEAI